MISKHKDACNSIQYNEGQNGQVMRRSTTLEKCADDQPNEEGCILSEFDKVGVQASAQQRPLHQERRYWKACLNCIYQWRHSKEQKFCLDLF